MRGGDKLPGMSSQDNSDLQAIHNQIDFGFEVQAFLQGSIGKYLVGRAEEEIAEAVEKLKEVDATDAKAIRDLQHSIWRAESIQYWLAEIIQQGNNAQRELMDRG